MSSSESIPSSFNPHAVHPFTAGTSQSPVPNHHHLARTPKPSPHSSQGQSVSKYNGTAPQLPVYASSTQTTVTVLSPQPHHSASQPSQPIFTPFRLERSTPELGDILVKKNNASAWSSYNNASPGANGVGSNVG